MSEWFIRDSEVVAQLESETTVSVLLIAESMAGGLRTFFDVGQALFDIRDGRTYRDTHKTFEAFCRETWEFSASRARQLISASQQVMAIESVTNVTPLPATESQARPLTTVDLEQVDSQAVAEVGQALARIRDGRTYRETHQTFEAFCRETWEFSRIQAHRLIAASKVNECLLPIGNILPATESQARPLTTVELEQVGDVRQTGDLTTVIDVLPASEFKIRPEWTKFPQPPFWSLVRISSRPAGDFERLDDGSPDKATVTTITILSIKGYH